MADKVLAVLTYKSVETILNVGGTQSWSLDKSRARGCKYAVVCRNANHPDVEGDEEHAHAFLVGKIKDVVPSTETKGRWLVLFSEYATADYGPQWEGRNPVAYLTTDDYIYDNEPEYSLNFADLEFKPMPDPVEYGKRGAAMESLTIAQAKAGLAFTFGVDPSGIEIVIRG